MFMLLKCSPPPSPDNVMHLLVKSSWETRIELHCWNNSFSHICYNTLRLGGAGLFGALSYMTLTQVGVSPRAALLIMLFVPVLMVVRLAHLSLKITKFFSRKYCIQYAFHLSFWIILVHPAGYQCWPFSRFKGNPVVVVSSRTISG